MAETKIKSTENSCNGIAIAAAISAMLGMIGLGLSAVLAEHSPAISAALQRLGQLWMPGAGGIGPYSGKETVAVIAWLGSWLVLHRLLGKREMNSALWTGIFVVGVLAAMMLIWPPMWHFFS